MRFILTIAVVFAFALGVLTACTDSAPLKANNTAKTNSTVKSDEKGHADDAPRITLADAKKDFDAGNVVFVDTRAEVQYQQEHIKGAINLPMEAFEMRYKEIPTGRKIIAYCS